MSDTDATRARQDVVADVDEILEHVINANMLSMPYDVYSELFDAVDGLGVKVEKTEAENEKLRKLMARMAEALGIDCEWADPDWCKGPCALEFGCWPEGDHTEIRCPAWAAMHELGVEVEQ